MKTYKLDNVIKKVPKDEGDRLLKQGYKLVEEPKPKSKKKVKEEK